MAKQEKAKKEAGKEPEELSEEELKVVSGGTTLTF